MATRMNESEVYVYIYKQGIHNHRKRNSPLLSVFAKDDIARWGPPSFPRQSWVAVPMMTAAIVPLPRCPPPTVARLH